VDRPLVAQRDASAVACLDPRYGRVVIPDFTYADLEPGYTSVTPLLHLGPATPFDAVYMVDPHQAVVLLLEGRHVAVPGSAEARVILASLGLTDAEIDMKLRVARYGVYEVLDP
jgi:hypothetical protein